MTVQDHFHSFSLPAAIGFVVSKHGCWSSIVAFFVVCSILIGVIEWCIADCNQLRFMYIPLSKKLELDYCWTASASALCCHPPGIILSACLQA